jgi:ribonuclease E
VAVLPGKDSLQPLAAAPGLVRSAASARAEVLSPSAGEAGAGRRRRGGRGGRAAGELAEVGAGYDEPGSSVSATVSAIAQEAALAAAEPPASRRPEPELVAVPMQPEQELVFGWLGLNPVLLLDPPPTADNLVVRVVRPGEDADAVLDEARQQLAAAGPRRRRRGRGGNPAPELGSHGGAAPEPAPRPVTVEITPFPDPAAGSQPSLDHTSLDVVSVAIGAPLDVPSSADAPASNGRRSRSRASASVAVLEPELSTAGSAAGIDAATITTPTLATAELGNAASEEEEDGEPRRRRRRRSAAAD